VAGSSAAQKSEAKIILIPDRQRHHRGPCHAAPLIPLTAPKLRRRAASSCGTAPLAPASGAGGPRRPPAKIFMVVGYLWWGARNWIYQVAKPSELVLSVSGTLNKSPARPGSIRVDIPKIFDQRDDARLARRFPGGGFGNPVARSTGDGSCPHSFRVYRPASSAWEYRSRTVISRMQALFAFAITPWSTTALDNWQSCWFNSLYARVIPSHA